jgi:hypothetical protein
VLTDLVEEVEVEGGGGGGRVREEERGTFGIDKNKEWKKLIEGREQQELLGSEGVVGMKGGEMGTARKGRY